MGGDSTVASEIGRGTVFTVRVPLTADVDTAPPVAFTGPRAGLLLVEANPLTQGVLRNLLESLFPALRCAGDGDAALSAIANGGEAQLLIDAKSAIMDGRDPVDALGLVIATGRAAGMRVTVLLAPSDVLPIEDVVALGADQLVLKPVSGAQLLRKLDPGEPVGPIIQAAA